MSTNNEPLEYNPEIVKIETYVDINEAFEEQPTETHYEPLNSPAVYYPNNQMEQSLTCEKCHFMTNNMHVLTLHVRVCSRRPPNRIYECHTCGTKCRGKRNLKNHISEHQDIKKPYVRKTLHSCLHCSYKTRHSGHLNRHILIHQNEHKHQCPHCNYKAVQKANLKRHIATHEVEKLNCELCDETTQHPHRTKKPLFIANDDVSKFICCVCGYKTRQSGHFHRHSLRHFGEKKFKCMQCDYEASDNRYLQQHLLSHF